MDLLNRIDIRAPQTGRVHELTVHTVGGVIAPGERIMLIVPDADALAVEVKIAPREIDQVYVGQTATMRFAAFNQKTTPEIDGEIGVVAADNYAGTTNWCELLHRPRPAQAGGAGKARLGQAGARHAGRRLHQDAGSNRAVLSYQALAGSGGARLQGTLNALSGLA